MTTTKRGSTITLADGHYWHCDECDAYSEETGGNLYECGECGEMFTRANSANDNHQCPTCSRFGSKSGEQGCVECGEGAVEQLPAAECLDCGEIVEDTDEQGLCDDCAADADRETDDQAEQVDTEPTADKVRRLWAEGNSSPVIAAETGLPLQVVQTMVRPAATGKPKDFSKLPARLPTDRM